MYLRDYSELSSLGKEIVYIDEMSGEKVSGLIGYVEDIPEQKVAFVYVVSHYKEDNVHEFTEGPVKFFYKDIMVFDDKPNKLVGGWCRDPIQGQYGKFTGSNE